MANNVVFKKGLYRNLPSSADENILFFCTDVGKIFQGAGNGKALIEYGNDVLSGFTDLDDLKAKNPQIQGKLYLTNDNELYRYDGSEYIIISGGNSTTVDLSDYMKISEYASAINQGSVAKADKALEIDGVKQAQPLMYYGTDNNGNVGFHYIPIDKTASKGNMEQRVILNPSVGEVHYIDSSYDLSDSKIILQAYKFVEGDKDIISTLKQFCNSNKDSFYYNRDTVSFENSAYITKVYDKIPESKNGMYFAPIRKSDFIQLKGFTFKNK